MTIAAPHPVPARAARATTLLVAGTFFMEMLDGTVITTALPQMGHDFGVSAVALNIGITAYLLALAVFIPISGWVADRYGSRTVFATAIGVFTLASILCAASRGLGAFTAARVLQGVGGAMMVPVGRLIVLRAVDKAHLVSALGLIVWPGLVAPVLGPPLGGFFVTRLSWHWIFLVNVPLGLAAIALTLLLIDAAPPPGARRPLDITGFALSGGALVLGVYGIDALGNGHLPPAAAAGLLLGGCVLGGAAARHLRRHPTPLLDLSALAIPTFAVVAYGGSLLRAAISALPFLLPLLFQLAFGLDALTTGGLVLFVFAGNLAMKMFTTATLRRFGFRRVMLANGLLVVGSTAACALLTPRTPYAVTAAILFAGGAFRSMQFTCLGTIAFADIPHERMSDANTLAAMLQQLMMGLGAVLGAGLLNASAWLHGRASGAPTAADFRIAFCAVAAIALAGLADTIRLPRDAGAGIAGAKA